MNTQEEATYDSQGRMKYNPDFHFNHKKDWTTTDQRYLLENYKTSTANELSLALGRTPGVIHDRLSRLRKAGIL